MHYDPDDTIAAISTAPGGAARGMVRLSGPLVVNCVSQCFHPFEQALNLTEIHTPSVIPGTVTLNTEDSIELPCELLLWPSERSYTRQPTAELHTLGSPPLLQKLLDTVCQRDARLAEPGEFTLRAFLAGRLDLMQAEAVLGVIDASSQDDLSTALSQLAGGLSTPLAQLREQLLQLLAELEAGLDFVEEDIEFITAEQLHDQLSNSQSIITSVVEQLASRSESTDLPRVVLCGPPNAGKSSLFNVLIERYAANGSHTEALVSSQSGTTRDFVTAAIDIKGLQCELVDTAGEESTHRIKSIDSAAQERTSQQRNQASLLVVCHDATRNSTLDTTHASESEVFAWTKIDLLTAPIPAHNHDILCSSQSGEGIEQLAQSIYQKLVEAKTPTGTSLTKTAARCTESLHRASNSISQALQIASVQGGEELIAAEVRVALQALGQVVGTVYTDDILDRIFGQFCIGK